MTLKPTTNLLAIDVGSSHVKLAWFQHVAETSLTLPAPDKFLELRDTADSEPLRHWTNKIPLAKTTCLLASVHCKTTQWLQDELIACGLAKSRIRDLRHIDLSLSIRTDHPDRVGIDRLLNAVAANHLRQASRPAIVVDIGTAITVDLIAADGAFEGGAILPGMHLAASALQTGTNDLPKIDFNEIELPLSALGTSTESAIAAGLHWGAVGAVRELISRQSALCKTQPELFITGGGASQFAEEKWALPTSFHAHMVLAGIFSTAQELS